MENNKALQVKTYSLLNELHEHLSKLLSKKDLKILWTDAVDKELVPQQQQEHGIPDKKYKQLLRDWDTLSYYLSKDELKFLLRSAVKELEQEEKTAEKTEELAVQVDDNDHHHQEEVIKNNSVESTSLPETMSRKRKLNSTHKSGTEEKKKLSRCKKVGIGKNRAPKHNNSNNTNNNKSNSGSPSDSTIETPLKPPPPPMSDYSRQKLEDMGGIDVNFLIEKEMEESDINESESRLSFQVYKVPVEFLRDEEKSILHMASKNRKGKVIGDLIEPSNSVTKITLKIWGVGSKRNHHYIFNGTWNSVVSENKLKEQDKKTIRVWSFRHSEGKLGLVMEFINKPGD